MTPVSLAVFGALAKRGSEPSAPRKIGIGMFIAALGFTVMALSSMGLPTPNPDGAIVVANDLLVSPSVLINTYLVLTFAELFLSPMGISFVSKVAPPKYKGLMMGLWFGATAVGNYLVSIIGMLWGHMPLWALWSILIVLCLISALFIFMMMKRLENADEIRYILSFAAKEWLICLNIFTFLLPANKIIIITKAARNRAAFVI